MGNFPLHPRTIRFEMLVSSVANTMYYVSSDRMELLLLLLPLLHAHRLIQFWNLC